MGKVIVYEYMTLDGVVEMPELKQLPDGRIAIHGSAAPVQSLMGCELIDAYPAVLFSEGAKS